MIKQADQRFIVLDVFRGMTVFLMIIVNTQGSGALPYSQLEHADWNGVTLTDLVFPSFLFSVGNAMGFAERKWDKLPESRVLAAIFRRTLLIFVIGYLLTWYPFAGTSFAHTRILAVLQRIALAYCAAALLSRWFSERALGIISGVLLLGYWFLLYRFGDPGAQLTIEGNAVRKLDLLVLGPVHMYREKGIVFDPEGILSTLPAIVNVLAGYLVSRLILAKGRNTGTVGRIILAGGLLLLAGLVWDRFFPFNKRLWSSSYVCFTTGVDLIVLGLLFYFIELRSMTRGVYFFSVFGKNPLFIYILSNVLGILFILPVRPGLIFIDWINNVFFQRIAPGAMGALLFALSFTMICWVAGWVLDRRKIYIRV